MMSNEYKDWLREEVLEHLPGKKWHVVRTTIGDEILKSEDGSTLTFTEAKAIQEAEYNRGYDAALVHMRSLIDREFEDV